jgi:aspartate carbamoyltransferase catalytic subunit
MKLSVKNLLTIEDLTIKDIGLILDNSISFSEILQRNLKKVPTLRGKTVANLFFEPSTRTRTSFEIAAKRLSADTVNFSTSTSSLKKGESIMDTINTILAMKTDLLVIRHAHSGICKRISDLVDVPIINAGDGKHEHPTQALLDLYTINKRKKRLKGLKVAIVGDVLNSRVARSDVLIFKKMGMDVKIVAPTMLLPENMDFFEAEIYKSIDDVIEEVDILYMLRMQFERQDRKLYPSLEEYNRFLSLDLDRLKKLKKGSLVMHPGPVNRDIEISDEVMRLDNKNILIDEQVTNGVAIRMSLLYLLLGK